MAFSCYNLVLKLASDTREIGVVARYANQKMAVILRIFLRVAQHARVESQQDRLSRSIYRQKHDGQTR